MLSLSLGLSLTAPRRAGGGVVPAPVSALIYGQSEMDYLLNRGTFYRQIAQPTPGDGNVIVYQQDTVGGAVQTTVVNAASVAAGQVNPAMAALSAFLAYARPGRVFHIGAAAVPGTSRNQVFDDADADRTFADIAAVVSEIETETGQPLGHLIECWYNSDASAVRAGNFKRDFWPGYFGTDQTGAAFTLGTTGPSGTDVDHCLWDGAAAASEKGRGIFARSDTLWHILTPMPFLDAPVDPNPEMANFSENEARLSEPARANMLALADDLLAQSVGVQIGPSAHLCRFGGGSSQIHPDVDTPDGQILLTWPVAVALLRAAGMAVAEPAVVAVEAPTDGSYADLLVTLPNGGTLTTLAALESRAAYAGGAPHQQAVTGVEVTRSGTRRPVYRTDETDYPSSHRGTVAIQSASETHATHGRVGRVRITPTEPFAFGDALSYLRGQATAALQEPRDLDLYPYFLLEHVPSLYDASADYPFPGVAVRPYQDDLAIPLPEPSFVAQSAYFDGSSYYGATSGLAVPATSNGLLSFWLRSTDAVWNAVANRRIFQARVGSTSVLDAYTTTSGRMSVRVANNTTTDIAATQTGTFDVDNSYHVLAGWNASGVVVYVNDTLVASLSYASVDMAGQNITQFGVGAQSTGSTPWLGDIGHLYINVSETLDLSLPENRAKFAVDGAPVDLGPTGALPTGNAPAWYYDGPAGSWTNKGTAGNVPLTGTLTAGTTPGWTP